MILSYRKDILQLYLSSVYIQGQWNDNGLLNV